MEPGHFIIHLPQTVYFFIYMQIYQIFINNLLSSMTSLCAFCNLDLTFHLFLWGGLRPALRPSINCSPMRNPDVTKG